MLGRRIAAALGPAYDREPAQAAGVEPRALLAGSEAHVGLGPLARHQVLVAIEARRAQPVLQRQIVGIADAHAPLLGAVDEEQAAERPEGLPAQRLLALLVEQDDFAPRIDQLAGGDQAGKPAADDDDIRVHLASSQPARFSARSQPAPGATAASRHRHPLHP